jgi:hypothetical protein
VEAKTEAREKNNRSCPFRKQEKQKQKKNKNRRKTIDRVLFACPFRKQEKKKQKQENQETNTCPEKPPIEPKNRYTKQEKKMFSKFIQPYT